VPQEAFDEIAAALTADRFAYFTEWNKNFFNLDETLGKLISAEAVQDAWNTAVSASPTGTIACVATWHTDFRADLPKIDIPVLILHGTADRILPIEACGPRSHELIKGSTFVPIEGASHGLCWTHADEVNEQLLKFFS
jgi:pimeloyl-ACP methyl ester carboxylesterase